MARGRAAGLPSCPGIERTRVSSSPRGLPDVRFGLHSLRQQRRRS